MIESQKIKALKCYLKHNTGVDFPKYRLKLELKNYCFINGEVYPKNKYKASKPKLPLCWYCENRGEVIKKGDKHFHLDCWESHQRMQSFLKGKLVLTTAPRNDSFTLQAKRIFNYLQNHPPDRRITHEGIRVNCNTSFEVIKKVLDYFEEEKIITVDRTNCHRHKIKVIAPYNPKNKS